MWWGWVGVGWGWVGVGGVGWGGGWGGGGGGRVGWGWGGGGGGAMVGWGDFGLPKLAFGGFRAGPRELRKWRLVTSPQSGLRRWSVRLLAFA